MASNREFQPESQSQSPPNASEKLSLEGNGVDVINHLRLVNPGTVMIPEVYGGIKGAKSEDVRNILEGFEIAEPEKFMGAVHKLSERAKTNHTPLNKAFLDEVANNEMIGKDERGAAGIMAGNIRDYASDPSSNGFFELKRQWKSEDKFVITDERIAQMDASASEIINAREHPELRDSKVLARTAEPLFEKLNYQWLEPDNLKQIARSDKYTPEERAAASIMRVNFDAFAGLADKKLTLKKPDIEALSQLKNDNVNVGAGQTGEQCTTSVTGNAAGWGLAIGLISMASGSKHSVRNAVTAATSAAVAAEIKNSICKTK